MALDIARLQTMLDELAHEADEAAVAGADLDVKTVLAADANTARDAALDTFRRETGEKVAKMQEMIAELQAAAAE